MTFLTVAELAEQSGRNEKTIRRAILAGRLPADKDAETGAYRITPEAGYKLYPPRKSEADAPDEPELAEHVDGLAVAPINPAASWIERAVRAETQLGIVREMIARGADIDPQSTLAAIQFVTGFGL